MIFAITGGTGFVGSHLIRKALAEGHQVRALTRRPQRAMPGVRWIAGSLEQPEALAELVTGADAVAHVAGVINGDKAAFHEGNVVGTEHMVTAAAHTGIERFVHISSLAAREPQLSAYGASKCAAEEPVIAGLPGGWTIIRPPAIYGPGDRELLELFKLARRGLVPLPSGGRLSVIAVEDLCRLILACLIGDAAIGRTYEPDDGRPGGWSTTDFARAVGRAVGRRVLTLPLPKPLLRLGATLDHAIRGDRAKLTRDRVGFYTHPDWAVRAQYQPPATLWAPRIATEDGLAATAAWYRAQGWL